MRNYKFVIYAVLVLVILGLSAAYSMNTDQSANRAEGGSSLEFAAGPDMQSFMLGAMTRSDYITLVSDTETHYEVNVQGETLDILGSYAEIATHVASPFVDGELNGLTVYVDPGHGGADPGAIVHGDIHESEMMLDIGEHLEELLIDEGARVEMSRRDDSFVDNDDRVADSIERNADLFLSLHANTYESSTIQGTEVYFNRMFHPEQSEELASALQHTVTEDSGFSDRGIREEELNVIEHPSMPSALVEIGYMTNAEDLERLLTDQEEIAFSLMQGVMQYNAEQ